MLLRLLSLLAILFFPSASFAQNPSLEGSTASLWDHNGSVVRMFRWPDGRIMIAYDKPRPGLEGLVPRGTVFFVATAKGNDVRGKAAVFKPGCKPAEYAVIGRFEGDGRGKLVVRGRLPIRRGCRVTGYAPPSQARELTLSRIGDAQDKPIAQTDKTDAAPTARATGRKTTAGTDEYRGACIAKALWEGNRTDSGGGAAYRGCDQEEPPTYLSFQCQPGRSQLTVTSEVVFPRKPDYAIIPFTISVGPDRHVFRAKVDNSGMYESLSFEMSTDHPVIEQLASGSEATLSATGKPLNIHLKGARQAIEVMRHTCGAPARPGASKPTPIAQQAYLDLRPLVDEITGMEIGVPADMPGTIDRATHGLNWKSADGSFSIDLLRFARDRSLRSIYDKLKGIAGRQITRDEYSERSFVLEGIDGGKAPFIVRVEQKGEEKRGLSVVYSLRGGSAHAGQARRIADTLRAFPDGTASESREIASAGETRRIDIFGAPAIARSFASPSRFNPPNAESVCREEYHALQSAAQRVRLAFPDRRSFQMGETFTISWTAPDWPKVSGERQILLQFDLPLEADLPELGRSEIKSGYDNIYHWTSNQSDKSGSEYLYPEGRAWKRFSVLLNTKDGDPSGKLVLQIRKAGNFTVSAHVAMTPAYSLSQARADCVNAKLTTSAVMPLSIAPMPPRFAQPKACHLSLSRAADLAAKIRLDRSITDGNVTIRVGQPMALTWQRTARLDPTCITPLYLVLSFPEEVRLGGDGFLALMPGAAGPFGISHDINKIRAIIPLHVLGAFKDVQVMSFRAGTATVEAALVEVPALREAPIDATDFSGENAVVRHLPEKRFKWDIQPAAPKVVVQDAFDTTQPLSVSTTPDGRYQLQVFKAHYRVVDAMNGALIVQRAGTQPEFSITGRFVASLLEDRHSLEIVDLISATPIAYMRSEEKGTYIGRGVQPIAWGSNDSFVLYAPYRGPGFIKSTLIERDPVEFISDGSKHANVTPMIIKVDLEQLAVAYQKNPGSASHSPSWTSLLGKSDGPKADYSPRYGTLTQTWPAFTHDLYRWVLGGATRFALLPDPPDLQALLSAGKSIKFHDEQTRSQWLQSTKQSFERRARDHAFFDRNRIPLADTPRPRKSPATDPVTERLAQVRSGVRSLGLSGEVAQSGASAARLMNLTGIVLRPNVIKIGTADSLIDSVDAPRSPDDRMPDPYLVETLLEHANSSHYQNLMIKHEGREHKRREFKRLEDVPVDFACEYDTPDGSFGKFISPARIMGRTAFKSKHTRMWLIQQDCWGGSGWRSVQLGLLVKKPDTVPEYHDLLGERLKVDDNFGLNSGKAARGWVTNDHILLVAMPNRAVISYDMNTQQRIVNIRDVEGAEFSSDMRLSEDRTLLAVFSEGGRVGIFQTRFSERLLTGVETDDELILIDDNGYYVSTPEGAHFVNVKFPGIAGYNTIHQFAKKLNRPDIIKDILAGKPAPPKPDLTPPPVLSVRAEVQSAVGSRAARLAYETTSATGLTSLRIFVDGRPVQTHPLSGMEAKGAVDVPLPPEARWISAVAVDTTGYESVARGQELPSPAAATASRLFAITVGTDSYNDKAIATLTAAKRDADAFAKGLDQQKGGVYSEVVTVALLDDADLKASLPARLREIAAKATERDTIMLFVAGHGFRAKDGKFHLVTLRTETQRLEETSLAWDEVAAAFTGIKGRVVVFLDACRSGAAGQSATNDEAVDALLGRSLPITVIAASKGRQDSEETDKGGEFTNAVLRALANRKATDTNGNGAIELAELYAVVKREVVVATQGRQTPWLARNDMVGEVPLF